MARSAGGGGVDVTAMVHALGGIDAPQPPLIQEGEVSISRLFSSFSLYLINVGSRVVREPTFIIHMRLLRVGAALRPWE